MAPSCVQAHPSRGFVPASRDEPCRPVARPARRRSCSPGSTSVSLHSGLHAAAPRPTCLDSRAHSTRATARSLPSVQCALVRCPARCGARVDHQQQSASADDQHERRQPARQRPTPAQDRSDRHCLAASGSAAGTAEAQRAHRRSAHPRNQAQRPHSARGERRWGLRPRRAAQSRVSRGL
jgi:hypothetical protein